MTRTLILFLGRVSGRDPDGDPRGYRRAQYEFEEQTAEDAAAGEATLYHTTYFGLALTQHLRNLGRAPDRMVVFGTSSSMWDEFLATMLEDALSEEDRAELREEAENEAVTAARLAPWQATLEAAIAPAFGTCEIDLRILPSHLVSADEQLALVREMTDAVRREDRIVIDVTHGFRHLPLLACFAALTMRRIQRATIEGIYYGAFEMRDSEGVTPVARLDGLLQIVDWLSAFDVSEATGDLSVFGPALRTAGAPDSLADTVRMAGFFRASGQFDRAARTFDDARIDLEDAVPASPLVAVFRDELSDRIALLQGTHYERLRGVAREALDLDRLDMAADFAVDAVRERIRTVYHLVGNNHDTEEIDNALLRSRTARRSAKDAFRRLRGLRNWFAHSGDVRRKRQDVAAAMSDPDKCRETLWHEINLLLPTDKQRHF